MFRKWPKIPRLENEVYHITEKIDGTNGCVIVKSWDLTEESLPLYIDETNTIGIWAQSRTRLITPDNDNFGFAKWVYENGEQLIKDLGVGYHYGEWWGQGINRGYGLDHKRFSLFNPTKQSSVCHNVPLLGSVADVNSATAYLMKDLITNGSKAAPGFMQSEGLVIYAEKAKVYWKVIWDK